MSRVKRVVITGYGAICSLGDDSSQIWDAILRKQLGYRVYELEDQRIKAKFFGRIAPERAKAKYKGLPKGLLRQVSEFAKYALVGGREAIQHAFGDKTPLDHYDPFECGVVIGTGWGGLDSSNENNTSYRTSGFPSPFSTIMSMDNVATAALSVYYNLRGYQNTPVAACASGAIAIGEAVETIRRGHARCMLAGGSESLVEISNVWSIDVLDALTKEQSDPAKACCPFSLDRSGFVLSEGAAVVVLEELESALQRGATILAEVAGYRNFSDAHDFTAPAPDCQGRHHVIAGALADAGVGPEELDYVNAHGTSTPLNDYNESEALKLALGEHAYRVPISSTKSYSGHLIGAAGALETMLCVKALETGTIPATANLRRPDPQCDLDYTPNEHRLDRDLKVCLNLSFGFGGSNAALVLRRVRS